MGGSSAAHGALRSSQRTRLALLLDHLPVAVDGYHVRVAAVLRVADDDAEADEREDGQAAELPVEAEHVEVRRLHAEAALDRRRRAEDLGLLRTRNAAVGELDPPLHRRDGGAVHDPPLLHHARVVARDCERPVVPAGDRRRRREPSRRARARDGRAHG